MFGRILVWMLCLCAPLQALGAQTFDAASAFGARESVSALTLSPDGRSVAFLVPAAEGQGSELYTQTLGSKLPPRPAFRADGKPFRLRHCDWVSNERLVCGIYALVSDARVGILPLSRIVAVNRDGSNLRMLSNQLNSYSRGYLLGGGEDVIDWLPDQDGNVLMARQYLPDTTQNASFLRSTKQGLGVDLIDTRTLKIKEVEVPREDAVEYISDGRGTVRIMGLRETRSDGMDLGIIAFLYRQPGSRDWHTLDKYNTLSQDGFYPAAVDPTRNLAYGFKKKDGRKALYSVTLDASLHEELIYARDDVDVDGLIRIGRHHRIVGASYATDIRNAKYFAPDVEGLALSLAKAMPQQPLVRITDSSVDENIVLVLARSDSDPGVYYILDRKAHNLSTFLVVRDQLEGVKLASQKPVNYPASDGTLIPAYLTLPPGKESTKGLPAIVMPHGGPSARDEWGFDWLAQFYASRGFAVLQPNYRGSSGYGDSWYQQNGWRSWQIAIGDINAGGRWLINQGGVDPGKLAIVGWSYGGYAALQSSIVDPTLFKAVVAIAPVTDLPLLKQEYGYFSSFELVSDFLGDGQQLRDASPAEHADRIGAPVLLFHGAHDRNVGIQESKVMAERLTAKGKACKLITWDDLDHQLEDSKARTEMLRASEEFLRQNMGMTAAPVASANAP